MALDQQSLASLLNTLTTAKPYDRIPVDADWFMQIVEEFCEEYEYPDPGAPRMLVNLPAVVLYQFMQAAHEHGKH